MEETQLRQHLKILGWLHLAAAGCAVIISHDRWFIDRLATPIASEPWPISVAPQKAVTPPMRSISDLKA